jgi:hypothetical protein
MMLFGGKNIMRFRMNWANVNNKDLTPFLHSPINRTVPFIFLKRIFFTLLIGHIPLGIALALLTPDDILANPLARCFTDFVSTIIPLVRETGRRTTVPATQFIAAVLYVSAIVCSSVLILWMIKTRHTIHEESIPRFKNMQEKHPVISTLAIIFFLLVPLYFHIVPYTNALTRKQKLMLGSKLFMGSYGAGLILSLCLAVVLGLVTIYVIISINRCSSESKNERE